MAVTQTVMMNATTGMPYIAVYKDIPFYLNIWFALTVFCALIALCIGLYAWFRISMRNRTNVIIHMPDKKRQMYSYKNFMGDSFNIPSMEKDKDGKPKMFTYIFQQDALETGYFGKYIEYDYGNPVPRVNNEKYYNDKSLPHLFKVVSAIINTQILTDLLLTQEWKQFVKSMLIIIVIMIGVNILISLGMPFVIQSLSSNKIQACSLVGNNETINVIRSALTRG